MSWRVVIPFKGAPGSKSRLAPGFDDTSRHALALAFLQDVLAAVRATPGVEGVVLVSSEPGLAQLFPAAPESAPIELTPDPRHGLNGAIAQGIRVARAADPLAHVAVLLGDLPELRPDELESALHAAARHPRSAVADAEGTGTTMIALAPGEPAESHFGAGSAVAHAQRGFAAIELPATSGLRRDVDSPSDLERLGMPGPHTAAVLLGLGLRERAAR